MFDDKGDVRMRAIAQLALAAETGGDVDERVQAAYPVSVRRHADSHPGHVPSGCSTVTGFGGSTVSTGRR